MVSDSLRGDGGRRTGEQGSRGPRLAPGPSAKRIPPISPFLPLRGLEEMPNNTNGKAIWYCFARVAGGSLHLTEGDENRVEAAEKHSESG